jgi:hypothetical protein
MMISVGLECYPLLQVLAGAIGLSYLLEDGEIKDLRNTYTPYAQMKNKK